jgi:hypothetical protein
MLARCIREAVQRKTNRRPTAAFFLSERNSRNPEIRMAKKARMMEPMFPRYLSLLRGIPSSLHPPHSPSWLCWGEKRLQTGRVESLQNLSNLPNSVDPMVTKGSGCWANYGGGGGECVVVDGGPARELAMAEPIGPWRRLKPGASKINNRQSRMGGATVVACSRLTASGSVGRGGGGGGQACGPWAPSERASAD